MLPIAAVVAVAARKCYRHRPFIPGRTSELTPLPPATTRNLRPPHPTNITTCGTIEEAASMSMRSPVLESAARSLPPLRPTLNTVALQPFRPPLPGGTSECMCVFKIEKKTLILCNLTLTVRHIRRSTDSAPRDLCQCCRCCRRPPMRSPPPIHPRPNE